MTGQSHDAEPVIVRLPIEIDGTNVDKVRDLLYAACIPSADVVVADLTATGFCDSCGFREMVTGSRLLAAAGIELRLALPPGPVRQVMHLLGLDEAVPVFSTIGAAATGDPVTRN